MDSILPALLTITVLILASLIIGRSSLSSFNVLGDAWRDAEERSVELVRSDISVTSVVASDSLAGTTDTAVTFSATTNAGDYVQASDGQLTIFVVNQDTNQWVRIDDISVTVHVGASTTVYDFTGITSPSATHTAEDGEIDETDANIANGTFGARRNTITGWKNWGEATTGEYGNLVGSDDAYYQASVPGNGDNAAMIFEFVIAEAPSTITQIDVAIEGAQGVAVDAWFVYLWNYNTSTYAVCCSDVDVVVRNDGATPVVDFSRMDVVVQYTSGANNGLIEYIDFTPQASPQPGPAWRVVSISNDVIDPSVLNTAESMTLRTRLFPALGTSTNNWIQVTTELGISSASFFTN